MQFLSINSRFIHFLESVFELIVLNLLTLLCCVPIITVGVAITALYRSLFNMRKGNGNIFTDYFKAFSSNFRPGLLLGLIFELICLSIVLYLTYFRNLFLNGDGFVQVSVIFVAIFLLFPMTFAFPLLSMFENSVLGTIRNAIYLSFRHFGTSLLVILMNGISLLLLIVNPEWFIKSIPFFGLLGISLPAWVASGLFLRVFKNYSDFQ